MLGSSHTKKAALGGEQRPMWRIADKIAPKYGQWHAVGCKVAGPWSRTEAHGGVKDLCDDSAGCRLCLLLRSNSENAKATISEHVKAQARLQGRLDTEGVAVRLVARLLRMVTPPADPEDAEDFERAFRLLGQQEYKLFWVALGASLPFSVPDRERGRVAYWRSRMEAARQAVDLRAEQERLDARKAERDAEYLAREAIRLGCVGELVDAAGKAYAGHYDDEGVD